MFLPSKETFLVAILQFLYEMRLTVQKQYDQKGLIKDGKNNKPKIMEQKKELQLDIK